MTWRKIRKKGFKDSRKEESSVPDVLPRISPLALDSEDVELVFPDGFRVVEKPDRRRKERD